MSGVVHQLRRYLGNLILPVKPKWPESLVILRHAESIQNVALDLQEDGLENLLEKLSKMNALQIPLSEEGFRQARETGDYFATQQPFDVCFTSPCLRAVQTAEAIVERLPYDLAVENDSKLREKEFGRFQNFGAEDIQTQYPEEWTDRERDGRYWYRFPRGENYPDVEARLNGFFDKLIRSWAGKNVLVVSHLVPYVSFRTAFEHLEEEQVMQHANARPCGIQKYVLDCSKHKEGRMKLVEYDKVVYSEKK